MSRTKHLKLTLNIVGHSVVLTASLWLTYCLLQIAITGKAIVGVEPLLSVRICEIILFGYGAAFGVNLLAKYIKSLMVTKNE